MGLIGTEQEDIVDSDFDQSSADEEPMEDEEGNLEEDPEEAKARKRQKTMLDHLRTGKSSFSVPGAGVGTGAEAEARSRSARQAARKITGSSIAAITPTLSRRTTTSLSSPGTTTASTSAAASPAPSTASVPKTLMEVRQSSRRTTVLNKQETELKLLEYETRRAMLPKREKIVVHKMTQRELLEEAKKTEAFNLASLQAFKAQEMEKKKVVKKKEIVMGTYIRYHSFAEWIGHGPLIQALADTGAATPGGTRPPTRRGSRAGSVAPPESIPTQSGANHSGGVPSQSLAQSLVQTLLQQQQMMDRVPTSTLNIDATGDVDMSSPSGNSQDRKAVDIPAGTLTPAHWATMNMSSGSIARKRKKLHPTQMCGRNWVTFVGFDDDDLPTNEWSYIESRKSLLPCW